MARTPGENRGRPPKPRPEVPEELAEMAGTLRERINRDADPVGFLIKIVNGEAILDGVDENGAPVLRRPTLEMRVEIAQKLTGKILPDLKALEMSGPAGGEIPLGNGEAFERLRSKLGRLTPAVPAGVTAH